MHTHDLSPWMHQHQFHTTAAAAERGTRLVVAITLAMMVLEIAAGYAFNSLALLADGWHMSSHAFAIGLSALAYVAARDGRRVIAIVLGCDSPAGAKPEQRIRDQLAGELMDVGFARLAAQAEAEAARQVSLKAAPKIKGRPAREPDIWDRLADLFSF